MEPFGTTTTGVQYAANSLRVLYRKSWFYDFTNKDFHTPGNDDPKSTQSIKDKNQQFAITTLRSNGWKGHTAGDDADFEDVQESVSFLTIGNFRKLSDRVESIAQFKSSVKDTESSLIQDAAGQLKNILQTAALAMWNKAAAGSHLGTDYVAGTVAIDAAGVVTGSGTTFTSAMVGQPFKAEGHTDWYRVKSYASATSIVIGLDVEDTDDTYDGGVISSGTDYVIQAVTALALTPANVYGYLSELSTMIDEHEIPEENRSLPLPSIAKATIINASKNEVDIERVHTETVEKGVIYKAAGFMLYFTPAKQFVGDNTNGFRMIGAHKAFLTAGSGFIEAVRHIPAKDNQVSFGDLIKGLYGFGFKVADERRKAGASLFATFAAN